MRFSLKKKIRFPIRGLSVAFGLCFLCTLFYFAENHIKTTVFEIAEIKAKNLATQAINDVIKNKLITQYRQEDLLEIKLDAQGRVAFIQPNTIEFNKLSAELVTEVQEALKGMEKAKVDIPIGQLTGNVLLAGWGPELTVKILPLGTVDVDLVNHFIDAGINQTKHSVGLAVKTKVNIVIPLMSKSVEVNTAVPIAEYIIVGSVPDTYAKFPMNKIQGEYGE